MKRQQQITISAYEMEVIQKSFTSTLKWLEFYIEKSGYSGNWKRQISETIKREDLNQPSEIKRFMETALLALDSVIEDKPNFVLEGLQEKFYSWLAKSGIRVNDCPEKLVECLVDIHKVLTNDGKEFGERVDKEASENIAKMTSEERRQKFRQTLTAAQRMMEVARAREENLEGKTYKDVDTRNQFAGSHEQGKEIFNQIERKSQQQPLNSNFNLLTQTKPYEQEYNAALWKRNNWKDYDYRNNGETREGLERWIKELEIRGNIKEWRIDWIESQGNWNQAVINNSGQEVYFKDRDFPAENWNRIEREWQQSQQQQTQVQQPPYSWR